MPSAKTSARPFLLVERAAHQGGFGKSLLAQRGIPGEDFVVADQDVSEPVAVQIERPQIGIGKVDVRSACEWHKRLPFKRFVAHVVAGHRSVELHQALPPFAHEVDELLPPASKVGHRGLRRDPLHRLEGRAHRANDSGIVRQYVSVIIAEQIADIALEVPTFGLLGQDTR